MSPQLQLIFSGIGAGAGAATIIGAAWATVRLLGKAWRSSFGRRRIQAKLLDQLACGSSIGFVESKIGVAQFIGNEDGREQRTYRLPGAWVIVEILDNAVYSYSITITSRWMHYSTERLTFKHLKVKLGKDRFGDFGTGNEGEQLWIAAYRHGYSRHYYFHKSGGYQYYWLSYNMAGCGQLGGHLFTGGEVNRGIYRRSAYSLGPREPEAEPIESSRITANTLTILSPEATQDDLAQFMRRNTLGVDEARVRLASTIRPPSDLTRRTRLRQKRFRLKLAKDRILDRVKRRPPS